MVLGSSLGLKTENFGILPRSARFFVFGNGEEGSFVFPSLRNRFKNSCLRKERLKASPGGAGGGGKEALAFLSLVFLRELALRACV